MGSTTASNLSIDDLPDDVLQRVFLLAGTRFGPAILGVSKRWAQLYWGHTEFWRHLVVSEEELTEDPIATSPSPPLLMFPEHKQAHQQKRETCWHAAKRAQLWRVGHMAEAASFGSTAAREAVFMPSFQMQLGQLLPLLSPAIGALRLSHLGVEEALLLPRFSQLTCLDLRTDGDLSSILPRLAALQRLKLKTCGCGTQLVPALQLLSALTRLEVDWISQGSLQQIGRLQQLRHLGLSIRSSPADAPTTLPLPASFALLESYRFAGYFAWEELQLADFEFKRLSFETVHSTDGQPTVWRPAEAGGCAQPGSLAIDSLCRAAGVDDAGADGGSGSDSSDESDHDAGAAAGPPLGPPGPQLNALLEAALPLGTVIHRLTLHRCTLGAGQLRRLPALASMQCLEVQYCTSRGSMDAALQALVQLAPMLTSLSFEAPSGRAACEAHSLRLCPAYLLVHPSLRSAVVLNRQLAEWDMEAALHRLPSLATAAPVLEDLTTDGFAFMPPALAAVTSLRSLAFLDQPQFELTGDTVEQLLALPHLTSLTLPQLTEFEQQAAQQLRAARPGLSLQVQPKREGHGKQDDTSNYCVIC